MNKCLTLLIISALSAPAYAGSGSVFTSGSGAAPAPAQASDTHLTIQAAIEQALNRNPAMKQSQSRIEQAQGAIKQAEGNLLPQLDLSFSGMASNNPLNVFGMKLNQEQATFNDFGAGQFTGPSSLNIAPDNLNQPGWHHNFQTSLKLSVPVYNGGKIHEMKARAEAYLRAAQSGDESARQHLIFEVIKAYAGVDTARAFVDVTQKAVKAANSYRDLSGKMYHQGVVSKSDLLHAKVNLGDVQLKEQQAEDQLSNALDGLRVIIGMDSSQPLDVTEQVALPVGSDTLADARRKALSHNPQINAAGQQIEAAQAGLSGARSVYKPHFNLMAQQDWNSENIGIRNDSYTVGGVLSWKVLDFGARSGAVRQAQAQVNDSLAKKQMAMNQIVTRVGKVWRAASLARKRVHVRSLAVTQNEEATRLERLRYQQGLSTMTDLLQAQAELDKARAQLVQARYQLTLKRAGLLLAMGTLTPDRIQAKSLNQPKLANHSDSNLFKASDNAKH